VNDDAPQFQLRENQIVRPAIFLAQRLITILLLQMIDLYATKNASMKLFFAHILSARPTEDELSTKGCHIKLIYFCVRCCVVCTYDIVSYNCVFVLLSVKKCHCAYVVCRSPRALGDRCSITKKKAIDCLCLVPTKARRDAN
jgi:hypothetical protein